jgi:hypothetical protein
MWLTNKENPRTQVDFDNSYTYKSYAIAFVNNYCVIFYIAFMKVSRFFYLNCVVICKKKLRSFPRCVSVTVEKKRRNVKMSKRTEEMRNKAFR